MPDKQRTYIAIDLKSFYASVECVDRGLDPLTTNLVVADVSRTEKTICLAVSPSMKVHCATSVVGMMLPEGTKSGRRSMLTSCSIHCPPSYCFPVQ